MLLSRHDEHQIVYKLAKTDCSVLCNIKATPFARMRSRRSQRGHKSSSSAFLTWASLDTATRQSNLFLVIDLNRDVKALAMAPQGGWRTSLLLSHNEED